MPGVCVTFAKHSRTSKMLSDDERFSTRTASPARLIPCFVHAKPTTLEKNTDLRRVRQLVLIFAPRGGRTVRPAWRRVDPPLPLLAPGCRRDRRTARRLLWQRVGCRALQRLAGGPCRLRGQRVQDLPQLGRELVAVPHAVVRGLYKLGEATYRSETKGRNFLGNVSRPVHIRGDGFKRTGVVRREAWPRACQIRTENGHAAGHIEMLSVPPDTPRNRPAREPHTSPALRTKRR